MDDDPNVEPNEGEPKIEPTESEPSESDPSVEPSESEPSGSDPSVEPSESEPSESDPSVGSSEDDPNENEPQVEPTVNSSKVGSGNDKGQSKNLISRQPTIIKLILGLVLVCCIGTILLFAVGMLSPDGINWDFSNDVQFTNEITIEGVNFNIPKNFSLDDKRNYSDMVLFSYSDGTNNIAITVFLSLTKDEVLHNMKIQSSFRNIKEDVSYGGKSGIYAEYGSGPQMKKVFVFEKGGELFLIEMNRDLNFEEYIPKIIS